jgi:hypothetical protein
MDISDQNINVHVADGIKVLEIRHGETTKPVEPQRVAISGNIFAPKEFLEKREGVYEKNTVNVQVNENTGTITLTVNEHLPTSSTITGKLTYNKDLAEWNINSNKFYDVRELLHFIRFHPSHFCVDRQHKELVKKLSYFSATIKTEIGDKSSLKGNQKVSIEQTVFQDLAQEFKLKLPVFEGDKDFEFAVDLCIDASDGKISFWLESVELKDYEKSRRKELLKEVVNAECFKDVVVIHQ